MNQAAGGHPPTPNPRRPRSMAFSKRNAAVLPTTEQSRRQADVLRSAWGHFGEPGPVIAFLNTPHAGLEGQPLRLAIESDEGLRRVEDLLDQMKVRT